MKIKSIIPVEERENCRCGICRETRSVKYIVETQICNKCAALNVLEIETEMSYVDLLDKLKADINSDVIPRDDKVEIINTICKLEELLWPYSH